MEVDFKVEGLKELDERLTALDLHLQQKAITSALRASAKDMAAAAKRNALRSRHPSSGALAESVRIKVRKKIPGVPQTAVFIGPIAKTKTAIEEYNSYYNRKVKGIFHGHFIERGFTVGGTHVPGQPWLRPAFDAEAPSVPSKFQKFLSKRIETFLKRQRRKKFK